MKLSVCDVEYKAGMKGSKLILATHRISCKSADRIRRVALDVCEKHKELFRGKTYQQCEDIYSAVICGTYKGGK